MPKITSDEIFFSKNGTAKSYYGETFGTLYYPDKTTTYFATCFGGKNNVHSASPFTIIVPSEECISIDGKSAINKGEYLNLTVTGCAGNVNWSKNGNPFAVNKEIHDVPLITSKYTVECSLPICSSTKTVYVGSCLLDVNPDKVSGKPGDEIVLSGTSCGTTVLWQDSKGNFMGVGKYLKVAPYETTTFRALCNLTDCKVDFEVKVPKILPPKIICEELMATAQPSIINKGELNDIVLTAKGCNGGKTIWNGPGLTTDTPGDGPDHKVGAKGVKDLAKYTVKCYKDVVGMTESGVEVKAELRLSITASPSSVEKGKVTTLIAEGCGGGTISWIDYNKTCQSPCVLSNVTINEPKIFKAICVSGEEQKPGEIKISVKEIIKNPSGKDYNSIFEARCSSFAAAVTPQSNPFNEYPYPGGTTFKLESYNCGGKVTWEVLGGMSISGSTHKPSETTTYVAKCTVNGEVCAEAHRTVEIYEFTCDDFFVTYEQKYPGKHDFYENWCASVNSGFKSGKSIKLYKANGQEEIIEAGSTNDYDAGANPSEAIEFRCVPDTRYPQRACYYTFVFDENKKRYSFYGRIQYIVPEGSSSGGRLANTTDDSKNSVVVPCQKEYPMKDLMGSYFATLICSVADQYSGIDKVLSEAEAKPLLEKLKTAILSNPELSKYEVDFSYITPEALASAFNLADGCSAAGKLLGSGFTGTEASDVYSDVLRNTAPDIAKGLTNKQSCDEADAIASTLYSGALGVNFNTVTAQQNGNSRLFKYKFKDGFVVTSGKNIFELKAVPPGVDTKWQGFSYVAYFDKENPDQLLGFYKDKYSGACSALYRANNNTQCTSLCQEGFLPAEYYSGGNKFFKDFALTDGIYYNAANTQLLMAEIDQMVESMMDQGIYDEFLKAGAAKLVIQNPGGKITDKDLLGLKQTLLDYKDVLNGVFNKSEPSTMRKLIDFFNVCKNYQDPANSDCTTSGIVPRCLWDKGNPSLYSLSPAFSAGVIDGGADMIKGFGELYTLYNKFKQVSQCWYEPVTYFFPSVGNCGVIREESKEMLKNLGELISDPDVLINKSVEGSSVLGKEFVTWLGQVSCSGVVKQLYDSGLDVVPQELHADLRCCQYQQGRLLFDVASLLYGAGEVNVAAHLSGKLSSFWQLAKKVPAFMARMNLPKIFSLKPVRTGALSLALMMAPLEGKAFQIAEARVVNSIEQMAFSTSEQMAENGGMVLSRGTEILSEIEIVGGGGKLAEASAKKFLNETAEEAVVSTEIDGTLVALLVINKSTGIVQRINSECPVCKDKQPSALLCNKLKQVQTKGGGNGAAGVQKLCDNLDNFRLDVIADKLLGYSDEEVTAFLGDVIDSRTNRQCQNGEVVTADLSDRVSELSGSLVDGWLVYKRGDRNCFRLDMSRLKKAATILDNKKLQHLKVNLNALAKITKATGETYAMSPAVAQRMDTELFDNLLNLASFQNQYGITQLEDFSKVITQLQTSAFYKQKGANWVIKNIASDPATFGGKVLVFEASYGYGVVDVAVFGSSGTSGTFKILIEYKSGPGASQCEYTNDDGHAVGNFIRQFVGRDLNELVSSDNKNLTNLQWRYEQPPANLQTRVRDCLVAKIDELNKLPATAALNFFGVNYSLGERIMESDVDEFIITNFLNIFKLYP